MNVLARSLFVPVVATALLGVASTCLALTNIKSDPNATYRTRVLFENLRALQAADATAFGQQQSSWEGVNADLSEWDAMEIYTNRSDVKTATGGTHPALSGWNVQTYLDLPAGPTANVSDRTDFIARVIGDYNRGMIIAFHWTMNNPINGNVDTNLTGRDTAPFDNPQPNNDPNPCVLERAITNGDAANTRMKGYLDDLATLLNQLVDANGVAIPIIFRPFHEMNGNGKWWQSGKPSEYVALWNYVQSYLRDTKGIHQLLYAYAPHGGSFPGIDMEAEYLVYWPGDASVDVCGDDLYAPQWNEHMQLVWEIAEPKGMVAAFTELGPGTGQGLYGIGGPYPTTWWTHNVLADYNSATNPLWTKCAYMMTWANKGSNNYFIPYPGEANNADFVAFVNDLHVLLQSDLPPMYASVFTSTGTDDGWVLESNSTSGVGGTVNTNDTTNGLKTGDDSGKKQVKAILSFDTASLPDDAVIDSVTLKLKRMSQSSDTLGTLKVDIKNGNFSGNVALEGGDFEAAATATNIVTAGMTLPTANGGLSTGVFNANGRSAIKLTGKTQLRLYFSTASDDDGVGDFFGWYGGEAAVGDRPVLEILYH